MTLIKFGISTTIDQADKYCLNFPEKLSLMEFKTHKLQRYLS